MLYGTWMPPPDANIFSDINNCKLSVIGSPDKFSVAATNPLGETCMASPAIARGTLLFRTRTKLVAIAAKPGAP